MMDAGHCLATMNRLLQQQRIDRIVQAYQLEGDQPEHFRQRLQQLQALYPGPQLELAICRTLAAVWLRYPLPRGEAFLEQVALGLQHWLLQQAEPSPPLDPETYRQITGLDPTPLFPQ